MSEGITKVLGYAPDEMTLTFFLDRIHPDDKSYFLDYESKIASFFKSLPFDKIKKYKTQYDIRVRAKDDKYVRILQQAVQVEYDQNNFYRTFDLQTDISHIKQEGLPTFSIIGLDGEPSYYNISNTEEFTKSYDLFTKREREILKCIVEGKNSKAIAEELNISIHTVSTHRKNILIKANCKTPVDLVTQAINKGWI
ncbi:LuxR C-terminal-related transcriptional regulator [Parasediminibacterium sp. JCM 36343]|uniref:LuxR C-terminal-related transcriptional regulator n=1 Tax=Parasediminibacterium sp. JCM 36343 TaxID=3374279 RepID=UPI00397A135C